MTEPSGLVEVGFTEFRTYMGSYCREIDDNNTPVLIKLATNRPGDRRPAVCMAHRLWEQIQRHYPDMAPGESKVQHLGSMREAQNPFSRNVLDPAAREGMHTVVVQPSRSAKGDEPWHVVYVPRVWWEEYARRAM